MNGYLLSIVPAVAVCCAASAGQQEPGAKLCEEAELFRVTLTQALDALRQIKSKEQANAAAPIIAGVHAAKKRMYAACDTQEATGTSIEKLIATQQQVKRALLLIPGEQFTLAVQQELALGCHGSTRLFHALHNTLHQYSAAQLDAPINEADAATLREAEAAFLALTAASKANAKPPYQDISPHLREFFRAVRAAQPGIGSVQQHPAAALRLGQLAAQFRPYSAIINSNLVYQTPEFQQLLREMRDNFVFALYTEEFLNSKICPAKK